MSLELAPSSCPSELLLDRLVLGELDRADRVNVDRHIEYCSSCQDRRTFRDAGFEALDVDANRLFERIEAAQPPRLRDRLLGWLDLSVLVPVAAIAAIAIVAVTPEPAVRSKGGVTLRVFRERSGTVVEQLSGADFRAGDRVRFQVAVPSTSQIMIIGAEDEGDAFTYFPPSQNRSAKPKTTEDGALVGAVELDAYQGREWLHLIRCERPFSTEDLGIHGRTVKTPEGCDHTTFEMQRASR